MKPTAAFSHENRADGTDVWLTPPALLAKLGTFDLDPCAAPEPRPWPTATNHITAADFPDGLAGDWGGAQGVRVFLNPPYKGAGPWLEKMARHKRGIALIFARTETATWQDWIFPHASALLFLRGRLTFCDRTGKAGGPSPAPSVLIGYGDDDANLLWDCAQHGRIVGHFVDLRGGRTAP